MRKHAPHGLKATSDCKLTGIFLAKQYIFACGSISEPVDACMSGLRMRYMERLLNLWLVVFES